MSLGLLLNMNIDIHGLALAAALFRASAAALALALAAVPFRALAAAPALASAAAPLRASAVRHRDLLLPKYQRNQKNRRVLKEPFC
ncbi:uncharacterized protein FW1_contig-01-142 [Bacillus sp. FW1]|nr:uncharacterized protein FW1_contig-01-142 [Bacillus sp. FW1]